MKYSTLVKRFGKKLGKLNMQCSGCGWNHRVSECKVFYDYLFCPECVKNDRINVCAVCEKPIIHGEESTRCLGSRIHWNCYTEFKKYWLDEPPDFIIERIGFKYSWKSRVHFE